VFDSRYFVSSTRAHSTLGAPTRIHSYLLDPVSLISHRGITLTMPPIILAPARAKCFSTPLPQLPKMPAAGGSRRNPAAAARHIVTATLSSPHGQFLAMQPTTMLTLD